MEDNSRNEQDPKQELLDRKKNLFNHVQELSKGEYSIPGYQLHTIKFQSLTNEADFTCCHADGSCGPC